MMNAQRITPNHKKLVTFTKTRNDKERSSKKEKKIKKVERSSDGERAARQIFVHRPYIMVIVYVNP
jgi:hypothetical protein